MLLHHRLLLDTRWRSWVVACSINRLQSTWSTLIAFSFRAEETFSHQGGACRHTDMHPSGGRDSRTASPSAMLVRHHGADWSPITGLIVRRLVRPCSGDARAVFPALLLLQVRRVISAALRNAGTDCCKTSGEIPEQHLLLPNKHVPHWNGT